MLTPSGNTGWVLFHQSGYIFDFVHKQLSSVFSPSVRGFETTGGTLDLKPLAKPKIWWANFRENECSVRWGLPRGKFFSPETFLAKITQKGTITAFKSKIFNGSFSQGYYTRAD